MALAMADETVLQRPFGTAGQCSHTSSPIITQDHVWTYRTSVFVGSVLPMSVHGLLYMLTAIGFVVDSDID